MRTRKALGNGEALDVLRSAIAADTDDCVDYPGQYGDRPRITLDGVQMNASRAVWVLAYGDPGEAYVLHRCHNDRCINPRHLYLGDHDRNMLDMVEAGRADRAGKPKGAAHGRTHLTDDDVRAIRQRHAGGESQQRLADAYGVGQTTISAIVRRVTWPHLD